MGAQNPIAGVQALTDLDALGDRRDRTVMWAHDSTGKLISGVIPGYGSEFAITVNSSTLQVTVGTGAAMLGGPNPATGGWPCVWLSDTFTLAARDATNPRIDLIIARVADDFYYTGGDNMAAVEIITGTPLATPVAPTPATADGSYITLGQLTVPSSANNGAVTLSQNTAYTTVPRAFLAGHTKRTYTPVLAQTNTIALVSGMNTFEYSMVGPWVMVSGFIRSAVTHSGGGGRPTITLPIATTLPVDSFTNLGTMTLYSGAKGTWHGPVAVYNNATTGVLQDSSGLAITDAVGNFDLPAGSKLTVNLCYPVA